VDAMSSSLGVSSVMTLVACGGSTEAEVRIRPIPLKCQGFELANEPLAYFSAGRSTAAAGPHAQGPWPLKKSRTDRSPTATSRHFVAERFLRSPCHPACA
jgi:hypothetical protein